MNYIAEPSLSRLFSILQLFLFVVNVTGKDMMGQQSKPLSVMHHFESTTESFLRQCEQRYGLNAVNRVKNQWIAVSTCLEIIFYPSQGDTLTRILAASTSSKDPLLTSLCKTRLPDIDRCIQPFMSSLKDCVDVNGDTETASSMLSTVMKYLCQNDGDPIVKFVAEGGPNCLKEPYIHKLIECFPLDNSLFPQLQSNVSSLSGKTCKVLDRYEDCVARVFQECASFSIQNFVQQLMSDIIKGTKCPLDVSTSSGLMNRLFSSIFVTFSFLVSVLYSKVFLPL